jgi:hypothetical protein
MTVTFGSPFDVVGEQHPALVGGGLAVAAGREPEQSLVEEGFQGGLGIRSRAGPSEVGRPATEMSRPIARHEATGGASAHDRVRVVGHRSWRAEIRRCRRAGRSDWLPAASGHVGTAVAASEHDHCQHTADDRPLPSVLAETTPRRATMLGAKIH